MTKKNHDAQEHLPSKEWRTIEDEDGRILSVERRVQRDIPVKLTDEEKAQLADDICSTYLEDQKLDAEKKEWVSEWKSRKDKNAHIRAVKIVAVQTGFETRNVDCDEVLDHVTRSYSIRYGASQYCQRPMRDAEYLLGQPTLFEESLQAEVEQTNTKDALLVASADGKGVKVSKRGKRLSQNEELAKPVFSQRDADIAQVMREEQNVKTKVDHVAEF